MREDRGTGAEEGGRRKRRTGDEEEGWNGRKESKKE